MRPLSHFISLVLFSLSLSLLAGDGPGNGGDPMAGDVIGRGYFILDYLEKNKDVDILTEEEKASFRTALRETGVEIVDHEIKDIFGRTVVSIVIPDPADATKLLIRINRTGWKERRKEGFNMVRFVFHEYLRVIGKDDKNYKVSVNLKLRNEDYDGESGIFRYLAFLHSAYESDPIRTQNIVLAHVEGIVTPQAVVRVAILSDGIVVAHGPQFKSKPKVLGKISPSYLETLRSSIAALPDAKLSVPEGPHQGRAMIYFAFKPYDEVNKKSGARHIGLIYKEEGRDQNAYFLESKDARAIVKVLDGYFSLALLQLDLKEER